MVKRLVEAEEEKNLVSMECRMGDRRFAAWYILGCLSIERDFGGCEFLAGPAPVITERRGKEEEQKRSNKGGYRAFTQEGIASRDGSHASWNRRGNHDQKSHI